MVITVSVSNGKIVGVVGNTNYSIKFSDEAYNKLLNLSDAYDKCESFDEVKNVISKAEDLIDRLSSNSIGEFLTCGKSGKLYIKGDVKTSPFSIPYNISKIIYQCIEEGKSYDRYIKLMLRLLYSNIVSSNLLDKVNNVFDMFKEEYDEATGEYIKSREYYLSVTKSGLLCVPYFMSGCVQLDKRDCMQYYKLKTSDYYVAFPEGMTYGLNYTKTSEDMISLPYSATTSNYDKFDFEITKEFIDNVISRAELTISKYNPNYKQFIHGYNSDVYLFNGKYRSKIILKLRENEIYENLKQECING